MPYTIQLDTVLETTLDKLKRKDNFLYQRVIHKIIEISKNPELGKPPFLEFEHHDKAYR